MSWDLALVVAGHALSFASFAALFVLVAIGRRTSPHRGWVLIAAAGTAVWAAGSVGAAFLVAQPVIIPFLEWPRIAGWLGLMLALMATVAPARAKAYRRLGQLGIGLPGVAIVALTLVAAAGSNIASINTVRTGEAVVLVGMIVFGLALLETLARWMSSRGRTAATYFFLGVGALLAIDLFLYATILLLGRVDVAIYQARGFVSTLAAPLIAIALARQRDWLVDIHISRQVIVNAATLMGVGLYLLAMALTGYAVKELNAAWGPALHITFLAGALLLLASILASESFRPRLNALVSRHFYSAKYDYRREWLRFSEALSIDATNAPIEERLLNAILDSVACRSGALWLRQEDRHGFVVAAARPSEIVYSEDPCEALSALMEQADGPTSLEPAQAATKELEAHKALRRPWAAIPMRHRGELVGFLVLANAVTSNKPDAEDREFLQALCVQAGAHLTEERSAVAIDRARRFESTARQLTYIGHDLKNIVSQFSMVIQNWSRHRTNEAFLTELPQVLGGAVQRMKGLLEGLKAGASVSQSQTESIDVRRCIAELLPLWRARHEHLQVEFDPIEVRVRGRRDHMQSIFDQLVLNAIEASNEEGAVTLKTRLDGTRLLVEIADRGSGINEKSVVTSRFTSGGSSKIGGYGVGLFQVRDYVRRLGGSLAFDSEAGAGTTAKLTLPVEAAMVDRPDAAAETSPATSQAAAPLKVAVSR